MSNSKSSKTAPNFDESPDSNASVAGAPPTAEIAAGATPDTTTSPASPVEIEVAFQGAIDASGVFSVPQDMEKMALTATQFLAGFGFQSSSVIDAGLKQLFGESYISPVRQHLVQIYDMASAYHIFNAAISIGSKTNAHPVSAEMQRRIDAAEVEANVSMFRKLGVAEADIPASGAIADIPQRRIVVPEICYDIEATVIESHSGLPGTETLSISAAR